MSKTNITVSLIGKDGNVFNLIGIVSKALKQANLHEMAKEFTDKAFKSESYNEVLNLIQNYVEIE